jgi:hypothetical protein
VPHRHPFAARIGAAGEADGPAALVVRDGQAVRVPEPPHLHAVARAIALAWVALEANRHNLALELAGGDQPLGGGYYPGMKD